MGDDPQVKHAKGISAQVAKARNFAFLFGGL